MRVGGLGVVDPGHAPALGHSDKAVGAGGESTQTAGDRSGVGGDGVMGQSQRSRGQGVGHHMGGKPFGLGAGGQMGEIGQGGQLQAGTAALGIQSAIDHEVFDHPHLPQDGSRQGEADGQATLGHVGLLDHGLGRGIGGVVHGRTSSPRINARLVRPVGGESSVPVEVIGSEVETGRGQRTERTGGVKLETGQFDGHDIGPPLQDGGDGGRSDVAHGRRVESGRSQDGREHADRGGLAISPRDDDPGNRRPGGPLQAPGEFDLAPHPNALLMSAGQDRPSRGHPRGDDEQIGPVFTQGISLNSIIAEGDPLQRRRHGVGRILTGVEQMNARAEVGQRFDDGEPGTARADDADARPGEFLKRDGVGGGHWWSRS